MTGSHPACRWLAAPGAGLFSSNHQVCGLCFLCGGTPLWAAGKSVLPLNYAPKAPKKRRGLDRASRTDYAPLGGWLCVAMCI